MQQPSGLARRCGCHAVSSVADRRALVAALGDTANTIEEIIVWLPSRESRLSRLLCEASERISAAERLLRESDGYGGG